MIETSSARVEIESDQINKAMGRHFTTNAQRFRNLIMWVYLSSLEIILIYLSFEELNGHKLTINKM